MDLRAPTTFSGLLDSPMFFLPKKDERDKPAQPSTPDLEPLERSPALDRLAILETGDLFWDHSLSALGLVCGGSRKPIDFVLKRLIASHIHYTDGPVLILHTDNKAPIGEPCSLPVTKNSRVLISPRQSEDISDLYSSAGMNVTPLSFHEPAIKLRHVLSLFTPVPGTTGSGKILNSIQHIVNQLRGPFDIQRFIELVDQEKWDDDGATFVALRQTILTELVSHGDVDHQSLFTRSRETLVDLTDPVLSATGLDAVLMDMALTEFLNMNKDKKKLIVVTSPVDALQPYSCLLRSLNSLASQGPERSTSLIIGSLEPSTLSTVIFNALDYVICGPTQSPSWKQSLLDNFDIDFDFPSVKLGEFAIACCGQSRVRVSVTMEMLSKSMPPLWMGTWEPAKHYPNHHPPVILPSATQLVGPMDPPESTSISTLSSPAPSESSLSDIESDMDKLLSPKGILKNGANNNSDTKQDLGKPRGSVVVIEQMTEDMYPETFRPLMKAIISLCDGQIGVNVNVESLRRVLGKMEQFKSLGWSNLTVWAKAACTADYLTRGGKGKSRWVALRPITPAASGPNNVQSEDVSPARSEQILPQVQLGDYPQEHYGLVAAVLQLTVGRALLKVQYEDVKEVMKQAGKGYNLSDASLIHMLAQASRAGVVSYGKSENGIWIQVEPPQAEVVPPITEPLVNTQPPPNEVSVSDASGADKFAMLLSVLMVLREKHNISYTPITMVAETLVSMAPDVFIKAGFSSILEYLVAAQRIGIVTITGLGHQQMIGLV